MGIKSGIAQEARVQSTNSIEATLVGLGITHEFAIGRSFTLYCRAGVDGYLGYDAFDGWQYGFAPAIKVGPRFYYDLDKHVFKSSPIVHKIKPLYDYSLEKRQSKPRRVLYNTATYVTIMVNYYTGMELGILDTGQYLTVIPQWGMRRGIGQRFYLDFSAGVGTGQSGDEKKWGLTYGVEFRIGYGY